MVKRLRILIPLLLLLACTTRQESKWWFLQTGDIVFQESLYPNHQIIGWLSKNSINHCGIVLEDNGKYYVVEVVNGVQKTPLDEWVDRGKKREYMALRLKERPDNMDRLKIELIKSMKKPTDFRLSWTDNAFYNAELVYKTYERALGIQLGKFRVVLTATLSDSIQQKMGHYRHQLPAKLEIITPIDILYDPKLELIANTFQVIKY